MGRTVVRVEIDATDVERAFVYAREPRPRIEVLATQPLRSRMGKVTTAYFVAEIGRESVELFDLVPDQGW